MSFAVPILIGRQNKGSSATHFAKQTSYGCSDPRSYQDQTFNVHGVPRICSSLFPTMFLLRWFYVQYSSIDVPFVLLRVLSVMYSNIF